MKFMITDKKRLLALLLLCVASLAAGIFFSSCSGKSENSKAKNPLVKSLNGKKSAVEKKNIVVTINNGAQEGDKKRQEEQKMLCRIFHEKYPGANLYFDSWQFSPDTFAVRMAGGTSTNVIGVFATEATPVIENNMAADITDLVKSWDKYKYINKQVLNPITHNGRIYGLPVGGVGGSYVMTLFYNKEIFKKAGIKEPPKTWKEFAEIATKLTDRSKGQAGFGILGEKNGTGWHSLNWFWQAGAEIEQKVNGKWKATFASPEGVQALQFIKDLRWKYNVLQKDIFCDNDQLMEYFSSGRIAMAIFTPEYLIYLIERYQMPLDKIGIALLPAGPAGHANQMGGAYLIIDPTISKEQRLWAFRAITFQYDLDVIEARCKLMKRQKRVFGFGTIPVFHGEYQKEVDAIVERYRTVPGQVKVMSEAAKYVKPEPPFYCQQLYSEYLGQSVQKVLQDKNADAATILKKAQEDFQKRYLDKMDNNLVKK